jgi:hypothetical protein
VKQPTERTLDWLAKDARARAQRWAWAILLLGLVSPPIGGLLSFITAEPRKEPSQAGVWIGAATMFVLVLTGAVFWFQGSAWARFESRLSSFPASSRFFLNLLALTAVAIVVITLSVASLAFGVVLLAADWFYALTLVLLGWGSQ